MYYAAKKRVQTNTHNLIRWHDLLIETHNTEVYPFIIYPDIQRFLDDSEIVDIRLRPSPVLPLVGRANLSIYSPRRRIHAAPC